MPYIEKETNIVIICDIRVFDIDTICELDQTIRILSKLIRLKCVFAIQ